MLKKIGGLARALCIVLAIVAGFVALGRMNVPLILVVLGLIAGLAMPRTPGTDDGDVGRLAALARRSPPSGGRCATGRGMRQSAAGHGRRARDGDRHACCIELTMDGVMGLAGRQRPQGSHGQIARSIHSGSAASRGGAFFVTRTSAALTRRWRGPARSRRRGAPSPAPSPGPCPSSRRRRFRR